MNILRMICFGAVVYGVMSPTGVSADEWIMGVDLTDDHVVVDDTCGDNFFGNTWKTNKYDRINGFGTLSDDGTQCYTKNN